MITGIFWKQVEEGKATLGELQFSTKDGQQMH